MRAQRSLTAFADPSRQLATFQRRSHRAASSFLRLIHIASLIKPDKRPEGEGKKWRWKFASPRNHGNSFFTVVPSGPGLRNARFGADSVNDHIGPDRSDFQIHQVASRRASSRSVESSDFFREETLRPIPYNEEENRRERTRGGRGT